VWLAGLIVVCFVGGALTPANAHKAKEFIREFGWGLDGCVGLFDLIRVDRLAVQPPHLSGKPPELGRFVSVPTVRKHNCRRQLDRRRRKVK